MYITITIFKYLSCDFYYLTASIFRFQEAFGLTAYVSMISMFDVYISVSSVIDSTSKILLIGIVYFVVELVSLDNDLSLITIVISSLLIFLLGDASKHYQWIWLFIKLFILYLLYSNL